MKQNTLYQVYFWRILFSIFASPPLLLFCQATDSTIIQITPASDIETLVFEEFIKKGNCVQIENIQTIGNIKSIGSFNNGKDEIGINNGMYFRREI